MKLSTILFLTLAAAPWGLLAAYFLTNSNSCFVSESSFCLIPLPLLLVLMFFALQISYFLRPITPLDVWLVISFCWSCIILVIWTVFVILQYFFFRE
jgi:hypothetical protein